MTDTAERTARALEIDPSRSSVILAVGSKGSGKSEALRTVFDAWPYNRVVLDVTGDARPDDPDTLTVTAPVGAALPEHPEHPEAGRVTVWARLDPRSVTYEQDQDDALALGLYPRGKHTLVWVDEYGELATANRMGPNLRLALNSSRHYNLTLLLACPRPAFIPRKTFNQVDKLLLFRCPNRDDRRRIADDLGWPADDFEQRYAETRRRGEHSYLLFDRGHGGDNHILISCPALPLAREHGPRA